MRWDVHYVAETGSTNADLLARARAGAPAGTVIHTGHQTAGRGRLGRSWESPPGRSLLASILLPAEPVPFVAVARVALAAAEACVELAGVDVALKWPNDLMVGERKLAGLLAETDGGSSTVVVGVGCNVSWSPDEQSQPQGRDRATALSDLTGEPPTPHHLLERLLARLDHWLLAGPDQVLAAYRTGCATLGKRVRVELADGSFEGAAADITPSGELLIAGQGATRAVSAGDVVHVRAG